MTTRKNVLNASNEHMKEKLNKELNSWKINKEEYKKK